MITIKKQIKLKNPPENYVRPIAAGTILGMQLINGIIEAQSAVMLPQLSDEDSFITITTSQASWIASLGIIASPVSSVLCGPLMDFFGRKIILQGYYLIAVIGFLIIAYAREVSHLYAGRFVLSIANGFGVGTIVYLPEMCSQNHRSHLTALLMPLFSLGSVTAFLVGGYLQWYIASAVYTLVSVVGFALCTYFTPESPCWLVNAGRFEEAKKSLLYLRDSSCRPSDIDTDIELIKMTRKCGINADLVETDSLVDLLEPTVWKPFFILVLFHFLQTGTGIYGLMYYTVDFFDDLRTAFDPLTVTILLSVARLLMSSIFGTYCVTALDRRLMTALSGSLCGASLLGAAFYEHSFKYTEAEQRLYTWIPVACILINVLVCTITVQPLPWLMTKELFPLPVRGIMCGLTFFVGTFLVFLSVKYFVALLGYFGIPGALSFFSASSFLMCLFGVFVLPETNNKSRTEIVRSFTKNRLALYDLEREKEPLLKPPMTV